MKTYQGSCHCGLVYFEIDAKIDAVRVCNCSICTKRGALTFRIEEKDFRLKTPLENLSVYEWHTKTAKDFFCPRCGILPFRRPSALTPEEVAMGKQVFTGWSINVRCLEGLDLSNLAVVEINGREL